jgi:hypothetical protein
MAAAMFSRPIAKAISIGEGREQPFLREAGCALAPMFHRHRQKARVTDL